MRLTTGLMPVTCSKPPAARPIAPAATSSFIGMRGAGGAQPAAGDQAEDHRAERRDEAQCEIAAAIRDERLRAREQVEEPDVERVSEIVVLVPVRRESAVVMRPVRGHAHRLIVVRDDRRVERPRQPIADQDDGERGPLHARRSQSEQEEERIAEADLRQRVFEGEVRLPASDRAQEDAERDQDQRPPHRMREQRARLRAARHAAARANRAARRRPGTRTTAESDRAATRPPTPRASGDTRGRFQIALSGYARATRARCSTSAIINTITKPR